MATSCTITVRSDGVAVLTIDQPDARVNVLTRQLWEDLEEAFDSLAHRSDLKGLVLASGKPGVFIAGADLKLLASAPAPNDPAVRDFIELGLRVLEKLESLPFPTAAAIDGAALGGGLEVALACDARFVGSHPKVQLGLPEVKLGLIPGWGGTQRLPRIVGGAPAASLIAHGEPVAAETAHSMNLAVLVPGDVIEQARVRLPQLDFEETRRKKRGPLAGTEGEEIAAAIQNALGGQSGAASEALTVMMQGAPRALGDAIPLETEVFLRLAGSPESKRLIGEFFASRKK
jgi:enoyl-CoA hydratase/carnithine racemase